MYEFILQHKIILVEPDNAWQCRLSACCLKLGYICANRARSYNSIYGSGISKASKLIAAFELSKRVNSGRICKKVGGVHVVGDISDRDGDFSDISYSIPTSFSINPSKKDDFEKDISDLLGKLFDRYTGIDNGTPINLDLTRCHERLCYFGFIDGKAVLFKVFLFYPASESGREFRMDISAICLKSDGQPVFDKIQDKVDNLILKYRE